MNRNPAAAGQAGQIIGTIDGLQVYGLDIAKQVFQLHSTDLRTGEIINIQIKRAKLLEYFVNKAPCVIAMEACGGAHHWAREFGQLGHTVHLLHAKFVRPFVPRNKTDAADARAIWTAAQQPGVKTVGIKSTQQQATLTLHRQRELLMKTRTMQTNSLRGLLYEFGVTFAQGYKALFCGIQARLEGLSEVPQMVKDSLSEQVEHIQAIEQRILAIEKRLALCLKADPAMQRIAQIPGVGVLCATAAIATMGPAGAFESGREFCAWLGMVPAQNGTGGKIRLGGISKRGDRYLRTLLIHGARSVLYHAKQPGPWLQAITQRRPANVVVVAQAAKMARTIWALTAKEQAWQREHRSVRPGAAAQAS